MVDIDCSIFENFNILYLEDDESLLKNTKDILNDYFKNVFGVKTINHALNIIKNQKVDVIISDILLKNENGLDFVKIIRNEFGLDIPIILTTAHANTDYLLDAIKLKVDNYIIKPVDFNILKESLYVVLLPIMHSKEIIKNNNLIKIISLVTDNKQVEVIKFIVNNLNDENELYASYSEIMNDINISKPTLIKLFKELLDKRILIKKLHKTYLFQQNELNKL